MFGLTWVVRVGCFCCYFVTWLGWLCFGVVLSCLTAAFGLYSFVWIWIVFAVGVVLFAFGWFWGWKLCFCVSLGLV